MAQVTGRQTSSVFIPEADGFNTVPAVPAGIVIPHRTLSIKAANELIKDPTLAGRHGVEPIADVNDVRGSSVHSVTPNAIGFLLKYIMGNPTTTGVGPYTHDYSISNDPTVSLPSVINELDLGARTTAKRYQQSLGLKAGSASLSTSARGFPELTVNWVGASASMAPAAIDGAPTAYTHAAYANKQASIELAGAAFGRATELSLNINNDMDEDGYNIGGSGNRACLDEGECVIDFDMTVRLDGDAELALVETNQSAEFKLFYQNGNGDGSAGNEYFELYFPAAKFQKTSPEVSGPRGMALQLKAMVYATAGVLATAQVKNQIAAY